VTKNRLEVAVTRADFNKGCVNSLKMRSAGKNTSSEATAIATKRDARRVAQSALQGKITRKRAVKKQNRAKAARKKKETSGYGAGEH